jgi:hypothetical protein
VEVGDQVQMGDIIGYSGKTGTQGAHLHFELKHGTSLHSPSVPINELFDGNPPIDERAYLSNNGALPAVPAAVPTPDSPLVSEEGRIAVMPTLTPDVSAGPALPLVSQPLSLNAAAFVEGEPVEATFTLRNNTSNRLHLAMLGVAGRDVGGSELRSDLLFFDSAVILNPGREYQFKHSITLENAGPAELFVFALGHDNEWIPLGGANAPMHITVERPALVQQVFLPAMMSAPVSGGAPFPSGVAESEPAPEPAVDLTANSMRGR